MRLINADEMKDISVMESPIFGLLMKLENGRADIEETTNAIINSVEEDIREEISKAPTVDAEPVRHGKWIDRNGAMVSPFWERYECTLCGARSYYSNYCPHCGAKMDAQGKDDA